MSSSMSYTLWNVATTLFQLPIVLGWCVAAVLAFRKREQMPRVWLLLAIGCAATLLHFILDVAWRFLIWTLGPSSPWFSTASGLVMAVSAICTFVATGGVLLAVFADRSEPEPQV